MLCDWKDILNTSALGTNKSGYRITQLTFVKTYSPYFMHECILTVCLCKSDVDIRSPGTREMDGCEPPCECQTPSLGAL